MTNKNNYYIDWITSSESIQAKYFIEALQNISSTNPVMIELGCAEAVYSRVFNDHFGGNCMNICIDILPRQINVGSSHCPNATFIHGYAGEPVHAQEMKEDYHGAERIYLDDLIKDKKVNILHMDIQGSETYVIKEIKNGKYINNIEYMFISLHGTCDEVEEYMPKNFKYLYKHPTEGGCGDGLMVVKNEKFEI